MYLFQSPPNSYVTWHCSYCFTDRHDGWCIVIKILYQILCNFVILQTDAEDITPLYKMMERDSAERIAVMNAVRRNVRARSIYRWVLNVLQYWSCSMNHFVFLLMWFSPYIIYKYKKLKFPAIWAKERWQWSCRRLRRSLPNTSTKHITAVKALVWNVGTLLCKNNFNRNLTVYCCVIQRLVTSDGSDGTQNDPGHPENEWEWLSRRLGGPQGLK